MKDTDRDYWRELPMDLADGYYWFRDDPDAEPEIVKAYRNSVYLTRELLFFDGYDSGDSLEIRKVLTKFPKPQVSFEQIRPPETS